VKPSIKGRLITAVNCCATQTRVFQQTVKPSIKRKAYQGGKPLRHPNRVFQQTVKPSIKGMLIAAVSRCAIQNQTSSASCLAEPFQAAGI